MHIIIICQQKRESVEATVVKDTLHSESAQLVQLRRELEQMSKELLDTREQLERLKQDVGNKLVQPIPPTPPPPTQVNPEKFEVCSILLKKTGASNH